MLRPWLVGKAPLKPVFPINRDNAAPALRLDLEAAGVNSTASYDFHSLRHTYVTMLIKSGASVKVCQELARHADPKLTMNVYTHLAVHDLARGLEGLAHILPTTSVSSGLNGTDGTVVISSPGRPLVDPTRQFGKLISPTMMVISAKSRPYQSSGYITLIAPQSQRWLNRQFIPCGKPR